MPSSSRVKEIRVNELNKVAGGEDENEDFLGNKRKYPKCSRHIICVKNVVQSFFDSKYRGNNERITCEDVDDSKKLSRLVEVDIPLIFGIEETFDVLLFQK